MKYWVSHCTTLVASFDLRSDVGLLVLLRPFLGFIGSLTWLATMLTSNYSAAQNTRIIFKTADDFGLHDILEVANMIYSAVTVNTELSSRRIKEAALIERDDMSDQEIISFFSKGNYHLILVDVDNGVLKIGVPDLLYRTGSLILNSATSKFVEVPLIEDLRDYYEEYL
jgi:hypothetical protein